MLSSAVHLRFWFLVSVFHVTTEFVSLSRMKHRDEHWVFVLVLLVVATDDVGWVGRTDLVAPEVFPASSNCLVHMSAVQCY